MRVKVAIIVCFLFSWSSVGSAGEVSVTVNNLDGSVAMNYDQQEALRKMVTKIKPAAGVEEQVETPRQLNYWEQKVVRRKRRTTEE